MFYILSIIFFGLGIWEYRKYINNYREINTSKIRSVISWFSLSLMFVAIGIFGFKD